MKGDALYAKAAGEIPAELSAAVPSGYKAQATIGVAAVGPPLTAEACQPAFADILGQGKIRFETGKASIQKDFDAVLDNLTAIAMRCPEARIEIRGIRIWSALTTPTWNCRVGAPRPWPTI